MTERVEETRQRHEVDCVEGRHDWGTLLYGQCAYCPINIESAFVQAERERDEARAEIAKLKMVTYPTPLERELQAEVERLKEEQQNLIDSEAMHAQALRDTEAAFVQAERERDEKERHRHVLAEAYEREHGLLTEAQAEVKRLRMLLERHVAAINTAALWG